MSEIPEDVMKMARHYANETSPQGQQSIEQHNHLTLAFARAIMAERERAALIAEGFENVGHPLALDKAHGAKIATAIRSGGRP